MSTTPAETTNINAFEFSIHMPFKTIEMDEDQKKLLPLPSGLTQVLLCSNWSKKTYNKEDFTGTTNEEAIKKILKFYKHKSFLLRMGDHVFFEGTYWNEAAGMTMIHLGS